VIPPMQQVDHDRAYALAEAWADRLTWLTPTDRRLITAAYKGGYNQAFADLRERREAELAELADAVGRAPRRREG